MPTALSLPLTTHHADFIPAVPGHSSVYALNAALRKHGLTADVLEGLPKIARWSMPPLPGELLFTVITLSALERRMGAKTLTQAEVMCP